MSQLEVMTFKSSIMLWFPQPRGVSSVGVTHWGDGLPVFTSSSPLRAIEGSTHC